MSLKKLINLFFILGYSASLMAVSIDEDDVEGYYGAGSTTFNVSVRITGITDTNDPIAQDPVVSDTEAKEFLTRRFYLEVDDVQVPLDQITGDSKAYYTIDTSTATLADDSPVKVDVSATLTVVFANQGDFDDVKEDGLEEIRFDVCVFALDGATVTDDCESGTDVDATAIKLNAAVNAVTTSNNLLPDLQTLNATWTAVQNPTFTGNLGALEGKLSASAVNVFMIKASDEVATLPGLIFDADSDDAPAETTCNVSYQEGASYQCIECTEANTYLDIEKIKALDAYANDIIRMETKSISDNSQKFSFDEEESESNWLMFTSYEPDAVQRSSCVQSKPIDADTWSLIYTGEADAKLGKECFVATAAYGTSMSEELNNLRWFRDSVLMKSDLGRSFVKQYYRYGPGAARFIEDKPVLRVAVRVVLAPFVYILKSYKK